MNKLFRLVYVNILKLFDFNKIANLQKKNIKSNSEIKLICLSLLGLFFGYFIYRMYFMLNIDTSKVLLMAFGISILLSFLVNLKNINDTLFYDTDTEYLFSLPIDTKEIVLSKLFSIYIKNIIYVIIVMISSAIAYYGMGESINDTLGIMLVISTLMVPLIPITIVTILSFGFNYVKVKYSKMIFNLFKIVCLLVIGLVLYLINSNEHILFYCYPLLYLFKYMISKISVLCFVLIVSLSIAIVYLYTLFISSKYNVMVSILKGVNKSKKEYSKKGIGLGKFFGSVRKDINYVFNNSKYFMNTFGTSIIVSLVLVCLVILRININIDDEIIKLYGPIILAMVTSLGTYTINSISLEGNSIQVIKSMPISFGKYLLSKVCGNLLINMLFIVINCVCYKLLFSVDGFDMLISFILPLGAVFFNIVFCLFMDLRFPVKDASNESEILNSRILNIVPVIVALLVGCLPLLFNLILGYKIALLTYLALMIVGVVLVLISYLFNRKRIMNNLFN